MKSVKAPKAAVLEVLAGEPLGPHTRSGIAKQFATVKNGELDMPSTTTIRKRIEELVDVGVDILSTLKGYLLVPKDAALWTPELAAIVMEAQEHYIANNEGNDTKRLEIARTMAAIPEEVRKAVAAS